MLKRNEVGILFLGISAFLGFSPLFNFLNSNIAAEMIGAAFSAVFILVATKMLISHQADIDQQAKKNDQVFTNRLELYRRSLSSVVRILNDEKISVNDLKMARDQFVELEIMAPDKVLGSYLSIVAQLAKIINMKPDFLDNHIVDENNEVDLDDTEMGVLWKLLRNFTYEVRNDLSLSGVEYTGDQKKVLESLISSTVETVQATVSASLKRQPLSGGMDEFFLVGNHNQDSPPAREAIEKLMSSIKSVVPNSDLAPFKTMLRFTKISGERSSVLIMLNRVSKTSLRFSFPNRTNDAQRACLLEKLTATGWEVFPNGVYLSFNFPIVHKASDIDHFESLMKIAAEDLIG